MAVHSVPARFSRCGLGRAPSKGAREQLIKALDASAQEALEAVDQEFFPYPDNRTDLLLEYVRLRPGTFGPVSWRATNTPQLTSGGRVEVE